MLETIKCVITIAILLLVAIQLYLLIARKSEKHTKKVVWKVAKFELPIFIALFTVATGLTEPISGIKMYMYFLIILYAIMEGMDNYKAYKEEMERNS